MKIKESAKEFAYRVLRESKVDIDVDYCIKHGIKFNDSESEIECDLFNSKSNKAAFDFVTKNTKDEK